jgi:uncharacterized protein (TIGR02757 family)
LFSKSSIVPASESKKRRPAKVLLCYPVSVNKPQITELFEEAFRNYHSAFHRESDPVSLAHSYDLAPDQEVAGFFAALLAYGNVKTILTSGKTALAPLGKSPAKFLRERKDFIGLWPNFRHRFTRGEDLEIVATWLNSILNSHGSIESFFVATRHPLNSDMQILLSDFVQRLRALHLTSAQKKVFQNRERNLKYLVSDPLQGSACKRLNMYLRWMVRETDGVDLGLWKRLHPRQLKLPIDTHLLQTLKLLKWTRSKQATWKVAEHATQKLLLLNSGDPIRYDFALCHLSMSGGKLRA